MAENQNNLIPFIESARAKNASDDSIAKVLKEEGWSDKEITQAFGTVYERLTGGKVPSRVGSGTRAESAKDAFIYLLSFSTLGSWTFALGSALFTFIDQAFPDKVFGYGYVPASYSIATEMATMIVTFPIYFFVMRYIVKDLEFHPEKFGSPIRRWLTYLALLIAVAVAIGDLITFLAFLLRGELTSRFVFKVITVLFISSGVLGYYLTWVKKKNI